MNGVIFFLIILDGVEVFKVDLNLLDFEVIESFFVLKDVMVLVMYGICGVNGVFIVKIKLGSDLDRLIIGVCLEGYVNILIKKLEIVDGFIYMCLYNEVVINQGIGVVFYFDEKINGMIYNLNFYIYFNVDWYKEVFKDVIFN